MSTKYNLKLKPYYVASVSGGKDSLYMLKLILSNPAKYPINAVIHFELEIDYPFIKNVTDYMERECKKHGLPFYRIKPRKTWIELYNKLGFPTRRCRWCNSKYKLDCLRQFQDYVKQSNHYLVQYVGLCYDETSRFVNNPNIIYPLVEEKVFERDILTWAKNVSIFNDYYKYNNRCGCMYCPLMALKNFKYLKDYYPEQFSNLIYYANKTEVQRSKELGRKFSVWSSNPKYDTIYRLKRVNNM